MSLSALLEAEALSRPTLGLKANQAFDAIRKVGVEVDPPKQALARTHGARFCMTAQTLGGLYLLVCEYADAEALHQGEPTTRALFREVKGSSFQAFGSTSVVMVRGSDEAALQATRATAALEQL